jgi:hypothetical protein
MMSDPVEPHLIVATRTGDAVAVGDPADALVKRRAAFRATHADFQVIDGIVHRLAPGKPCQGVVDGALRKIAPSFRATIGIRIYTCRPLPRKAC